ncbi:MULTISPECIES: hypothetical protein [unclassified Mesorhizobium]|nr:MULTISPECIES: hypothetical protein [unclassified Mesorhizobium]
MFHRLLCWLGWHEDETVAWYDGPYTKVYATGCKHCGGINPR